MIDNVNRYLSSLELAKKMYKDGTITKDDLVKFEAFLIKKHCIKPKSIYRINDLIKRFE